MNLPNLIALIIGYIFMTIGGIYVLSIVWIRLIFLLGNQRKLVRWMRKGKELDK